MDPLTATLNFATAFMNFLALPANAPWVAANAQLNADLAMKFATLFEKAHAKQVTTP
jgi:hypothetical protein